MLARPVAVGASAALRGGARALSNKTVRDVMDEKRSFRAGEDLKIYLKKQFEMSTVDKGVSVAKVLDKMVAAEANVLVVLDADKSIAGIVSDRDYIKLAQKRNAGKESRADSNVPVDDIMTKKKDVVSVSYQDSVEHCQDLMANSKIRHLPVLHQGKLHGILSFVDFLHAPSRFEPEARRAIFAEEGVNIVVDDYSFSLTDLDADKVKADLAKRVNAVKNRPV